VILIGRKAKFSLTLLFGAALVATDQPSSANTKAGCEPADEIASVGSESGPISRIAAHLEQSLQQQAFPELRITDIRIRTFHSHSDYLQTRFSIVRFFLPLRMRYYVDINPALIQKRVPADGFCAIFAHELAHIVVLSHGNRIRRLGLIRLLSKHHTAVFERRADLDVIHRGYGEGLTSFHGWLYPHIPAAEIPAKRRNYFSPEEISLIEKKLQTHRDLFEYWNRHVPLNLHDIQRASEDNR
jgi:hypothetical protein